jgi:hypothetical protein
LVEYIGVSVAKPTLSQPGKNLFYIQMGTIQKSRSVIYVSFGAILPPMDYHNLRGFVEIFLENLSESETPRHSNLRRELREGPTSCGLCTHLRLCYDTP